MQCIHSHLGATERDCAKMSEQEYEGDWSSESGDGAGAIAIGKYSWHIES